MPPSSICLDSSNRTTNNNNITFIRLYATQAHGHKPYIQIHNMVINWKIEMQCVSVLSIEYDCQLVPKFLFSEVRDIVFRSYHFEHADLEKNHIPRQNNNSNKKI